MKNLWNAEPVMIVALVNAVLALVMAFGVTVTPAQTAAVLGVVNAVLAIVVRSRVTSPQTLQDMTPRTLAAAQDTAGPIRDTAKKLPIVLLAVLLGSSMACAPPPTIVTPQGQVAYKADQVVVRVNELMNAAIAANAANTLPTDTTRTIVSFCVDADKVLAATPNGWQTTLTLAWRTTKAKLPKIDNPAIVAAMGAVDVVIGVAQ